MPFSGHWANASANASCMASSARSNEPETLIRLAMIRPDSRRKTDSTVLLRLSTYNSALPRSVIRSAPQVDLPVTAGQPCSAISILAYLVGYDERPGTGVGRQESLRSHRRLGS